MSRSVDLYTYIYTVATVALPLSNTPTQQRDHATVNLAHRRPRRAQRRHRHPCSTTTTSADDYENRDRRSASPAESPVAFGPSGPRYVNRSIGSKLSSVSIWNTFIIVPTSLATAYVGLAQIKCSITDTKTKEIDNRYEIKETEITQGLMSHQTHYRSYRGRVCFGSNDPTNSVKPIVSKHWRKTQD